MNEKSDYNKIVSVILIFVILIQMPGCVSTKVINSISDIPVAERYTHILHTPTTTYLLLNTRISDGNISGNLINGKHKQSAYKVHFFLPHDSVLKFNSDMLLVLPYDKISKIEVESPAKGATAIFFGGLIFVTLLIITVVSVNSGYRGM